MSDGKKVDAQEAREKVEIIREMLEDQCKQIVIAGSLRRGKALVGDAEIVALPKYAPYRAVDGYWTDVESGRRIRTQDEGEMFKLLGINYIVPPHLRTLQLYAGLMRYPRWAKEVHYIAQEEPPTSTQASMF